MIILLSLSLSVFFFSSFRFRLFFILFKKKEGFFALFIGIDPRNDYVVKRREKKRA